MPVVGRRVAPVTALLAGLALLALPRVAEGAACCLSATAFGTGRLLPWERFALGVRTALISTLGQWDADHRWQGRGAYRAHDWRSELYGMVALPWRLELQARLPWLVTYRSTAELSETGGGLGDAQAGLRWDAIRTGSYPYVPGVALLVGVLVPSGRPWYRSGTTLGADVTGRGAWVLSFATSLEWVRDPLFGRIDLGVTVPLPSERDGPTGPTRTRYGTGLQVAAAGGWEVARNTVLSLIAHTSWESSVLYQGALQPDSGTLETGLGVAASYRVHPHFTLHAAFDTGLFFRGLGRNLPGRMSGTLGLRYGYF
ncbi:MAG: hypothetical protein IT371_16140 [Deltaproteobacteria bacterium]|nr:hypothetical protein [Deltaproteobacteria bacterium]